jgi:hypothetical protein
MPARFTPDGRCCSCWVEDVQTEGCIICFPMRTEPTPVQEVLSSVPVLDVSGDFLCTLTEILRPMIRRAQSNRANLHPLFTFHSRHACEINRLNQFFLQLLIKT